MKTAWLLTCILLWFGSTTLHAQDSDSLFSKARDLGFNGKRKEARDVCYQALNKSPNYTDIWIFLGRLYSWDSQYDSAKICFEKSIQINPNYLDAYSAYCDAESWSDNFLGAVKIADQALNIDSNFYEIRLKKARALNNLKRYEEAQVEVRKVLKQDPKNEAAFSLATNIKRNVQINRIGLQYDYDWFDKQFDPWHLYSLSYARRTNDVGTLVGRVNVAQRFGTSAAQFEMDAYPTVSEKMYMYLNVGYGNNSLFPTYRWGASLYRSLPKSFEAEVGVRQLQFSTATWILTGSIGYYWKNYWFNLRPNYVPNAVGSSESLIMTVRYFIEDADDFVTVLFGAGVSIDELQVNSGDGSFNQGALLSSNRLRISYQTMIKNSWYLYANVGYAEEETTFNGFRKNYTISLGFDKVF